LALRKDDLVATESKKVASSGRHRLPARIRRNKVPLKPPYVASNLEIFKSPVRKAFKKRLDALSDFFLAEVSLPEAIWSNGSVVDAIDTGRTEDCTRPMPLRQLSSCNAGTIQRTFPVCTENLSSGVMVVKSAQNGARTDHTGSLNRARNRRILVQGSMRSNAIVLDECRIAFFSRRGD
jgi:hypothetical protein